MGRRFGVLAALVVMAVFASTAWAANAGRAGGDSVTAISASGADTAFKLPTCTDPSSSGALRVSGNAVLTASGTRFTFYGISVFGGLENAVDSSTWTRALASATAQIKAAPHWHANTVRIQVSERNLFMDMPRGDPVNVAVLRSLCNEVRLARHEGLQVVINDQTEWPNWDERGITSRTMAFWIDLGKIYGNEPGVSFDLFNEPRTFHEDAPPAGTTPPAPNNAWVWNNWRNGGLSEAVRYIGTQTLVNDIRARKWDNIIWVEGPYLDDALGSYSHYAITGSNLVISLHHPVLAVGVKGWKRNFGYLAARYPLVDGEWSQYAADKPECQSDAYKMTPVFLAYLRSINVGLVAWALQGGALTWDAKHYVPANLTQAWDSTNVGALLRPSRMYPDYSCTTKGAGQGSGQLIYNYFSKYAQPS